MLFALGTFCAVTGCFQSGELQIARLINPNRNENAVLMFFSAIGEYYGIFAIIALLLLFPDTRAKVALPTAVTTLLSWIINELIKVIFVRERPAQRLLESTFLRVHGYSFPSGHAMNSTAMYICAMLLILPLCKRKWQKALTVFVCIGMSAVIGFSRVYFNVHYVSDVFGGWCIGAFFGILGSTVYSMLKGKKDNGNNRTKTEVSDH